MIRQERGLSDSVQWAMLTPLVLLVLFGTIQLGVLGHGRLVAFDAAVAAAEEEALADSPSGAGRALAESIGGSGGLAELSVVVTDDGASVTAQVTGHVPGLIDLGLTKVDAQVTRPKERVTVP